MPLLSNGTSITKPGRKVDKRETRLANVQIVVVSSTAPDCKPSVILPSTAHSFSTKAKLNYRLQCNAMETFVCYQRGIHATGRKGKIQSKFTQRASKPASVEQSSSSLKTKFLCIEQLGQLSIRRYELELATTGKRVQSKLDGNHKKPNSAWRGVCSAKLWS